jgi:hypothetical protein
LETPAVNVTAPPIVKLETPVPTTCHVCAAPTATGALIVTAPAFAATKIPVELELGESVNVPPVPWFTVTAETVDGVLWNCSASIVRDPSKVVVICEPLVNGAFVALKITV